MLQNRDFTVHACAIIYLLKFSYEQISGSYISYMKIRSLLKEDLERCFRLDHDAWISGSYTFCGIYKTGSLLQIENKVIAGPVF